mgnify:CR=1 FL=1
MISESELRKLVPQALRETNLPMPGKESGKVRDWYPLPGGRRLIITTDRLSAFDRVLAEVTTEDVAGLENDGFFLGGHGRLAEIRTPTPPALSGQSQRRAC